MNIISVITIAACLCLGLSGCAQKSADQSSAKSDTESVVQTPASTELTPSSISSDDTRIPSFQADTLNGDTFSSDQLADSRLTMINVWATYCNPCLQEMPDLGVISHEYDASDFQLVGIVSDVMPGDEKALTAAQELVETTGADYTHLIMNQELYNALLTDVAAVPTTFFLDEEGNVLDTIIGAKSGDAWRSIIDEYLEK